MKTMPGGKVFKRLVYIRLNAMVSPWCLLKTMIHSSAPSQSISSVPGDKYSAGRWIRTAPTKICLRASIIRTRSREPWRAGPPACFEGKGPGLVETPSRSRAATISRWISCSGHRDMNEVVAGFIVRCEAKTGFWVCSNGRSGSATRASETVRSSARRAALYTRTVATG